MNTLRHIIPSLIAGLCGITAMFGQPYRTATASATVINGFVVEVTVTDGGSGYQSSPYVTFSGGGGSGATAIATATNGMVAQIVVQTAGAGYLNPPTVIIGPPRPPPTLADLKIATNAGLTITGGVGTVYSIEYVTDLTEPTEGEWRCLEFLQLPASPYLWADKSAPAITQRFYRAVAMEAPTNMVFIPPGTFRMGSPENEEGRELREGPQTEVIISRGYWMWKNEVTQGEYLAVMGSNPSYFNGVRGEGTQYERDFGVDLTRPVESVGWYDATNYCAKLTERERLAGRIPPNSVYRLPTEAEWEYACRAWTSTRYSYGDDPGYTNLTNYAWYRDNSNDKTHPVGQKLPNPWGLHDMHGNVFEWCQDRYGDYAGGISLDPQGPEAGPRRVIRGGDCYYYYGGVWSVRSAYRYYDITSTRAPSLGFRIVLAPGQP